MDGADAIALMMQWITSRGFDPHTSPWDHKVCVMMHAAQGIIDNGGFEYFFGIPFELDPDMNDFVAVFEAVGAISSARAVREALARSKTAEPAYDDLNEVLWRESKNNWQLLTTYITSYPQSYK